MSKFTGPAALIALTAIIVTTGTVRAETPAASPAAPSAPSAARRASTNSEGYALMKAHKFAEACEVLERAVAANPASKVAWANLGACRLTLYEAGLADRSAADQAADAYRKAVALDSSYRADALKVAEDAVRQEDAWAAAAKAREGKPVRAPAATGTLREYGAAGDAAEREGDFALAAANFARAREVAASDKSRSVAENWSGLLSLKQRQPKAAVEHLRKATALDPANKYAWNNLGAALRRQYEPTGDAGALKEAASAFRRVGELDPEYNKQNREWAAAEMAAAGITDEDAPQETAATSAVAQSPAETNAVPAAASPAPAAPAPATASNAPAQPAKYP